MNPGTLTIPEAVARAQQIHNRGELAPAVEIYRRVLEVQPRHVGAWFLLGTACHQLGRLDDAIGCYRKALALQPAHAEALGNLGTALKGQGKLAEARACYDEALRHKPELAEAHNNLGNVFHLEGERDRAAACYREAIRLRPTYAEAHNNLGVVLTEQRKLDEAVASLREAMRLRPRYVEAMVNLGVALVEQKRLDDAAAAYEAALRLDPRCAAAHNNYTDVLLEQGHLDEALHHARETLRLDRDCGNAWYNLGDLAGQGHYEFTEDELAHVRAMVARPGLPPEQAALLHFALAKVLDRRDDPDAAFAHYQQGNALRHEQFKRMNAAFDPERQRRLVEGVMAVSTPDWLDRLRGAGSASELPVLIVGMPRSGTSLVEQVLASHPQVHGAGELREVTNLAVRLPARLGSAEEWPACAAGLEPAVVRVMAEEHLGRLQALDGAATRVTDKMPENFQYLGLIAALFPRARVIHCRRDPLDTCVSCYFQNFITLNIAWELTHLGVYYRLYERLMEHWRAVLPLRVCEVWYEELVADLEGVGRRLVSFTGLEWDPRCLDFHRTKRVVQTASKLQVRKPVYRSSVGRWRRYARHLRPLTDALGLPPADVPAP